MKKKKKLSHIGPNKDKGGARGAPLWPLMLFSEAGPGRVKIKCELVIENRFKYTN